MRKSLPRFSCSCSLLFYGTKAETAQVMQSFTLCLLEVKGVVAHWSTEHMETEVLWTTPFHLYIICKFRVITRSHINHLIHLIQMKAAVFTNHPHCKTYYLSLMSLTSRSSDEMAQLGRMEFWIWHCCWPGAKGITEETFLDNTAISIKLCQQ